MREGTEGRGIQEVNRARKREMSKGKKKKGKMTLEGRKEGRTEEGVREEGKEERKGGKGS